MVRSSKPITKLILKNKNKKLIEEGKDLVFYCHTSLAEKCKKKRTRDEGQYVLST